MNDYKNFDIPGFVTQSGCTLNVKLAYKTFGELAPDGGNTLLRFTHADWQAETDYFVSCTTVWGELMFRIKAAAEGQTPGPLFVAAGLAY